MKKLFPLILFLLAPLALADEYSQTVSLSTASSAVTTALNENAGWAVQCDGEVRYRTCVSSTCTAVSTDAKLTVDAFATPVDIKHSAAKKYIALIRTGSSTVTCYIYHTDAK